MSKYRIGRIDSPWVNFAPPIRGGIYRQLGDDEAASSSEEEDVDSSVASSNSSSTSVDTIKSSITPNVRGDLGKSLFSRSGNTIDRLRDSVTSQTDVLHSEDSAPTSSYSIESYTTPVSIPTGHQCPTAYVSSVIQKEIDDNVREYPFLDAATQRDITRKYQALHQRVKIEGFYDCRYGEYAKEAVRYAALFSVFLVSLHYGWYMTSAAFLGFFWVCLHNPTPQPHLTITASNHVHRPRCWSSWHNPQFRCRYLNRHVHRRLLLRLIYRLVEK